MIHPIPAELADIMRVGWRTMVRLMALVQVLVGVGLFVDGAPLPETTFYAAATLLPWWSWATWAITAGTIALLGPTWPIRWAGLALVDLWYGAWAVVITVGVAEAGFPWYAPAVYGGLVGLHTLIVVVEWQVGEVLSRDRTR